MGEVLRALATADPAVAVTLSMHSHLLAFQVWRHRHGQDASAVFGKVVNGALLVSTGAADWVGSSGTTEKVDGGYRVQGPQVTGERMRDRHDHGDELPVGGRSRWAVGHPLRRSVRGRRGFDRTRRGTPWACAPRARTPSSWTTCSFPTPRCRSIRPADVWHPVWNTVMGAAMPLITAAYLGIADRAVELAIEAAEGTTDPTRIQLVGEMLNARTTAADSVDAMFVASDNLEFANIDEIAASTLSRKTIAAQNIIRTVEMAREVVGGASFSRSNEMERLLRDAHGVVFHPLPAHRQAQLTGRVALGLSPVG